MLSLTVRDISFELKFCELIHKKNRMTCICIHSRFCTWKPKPEKIKKVLECDVFFFFFLSSFHCLLLACSSAPRMLLLLSIAIPLCSFKLWARPKYKRNNYSIRNINNIQHEQRLLFYAYPLFDLSLLHFAFSPLLLSFLSRSLCAFFLQRYLR